VVKRAWQLVGNAMKKNGGVETRAWDCVLKYSNWRDHHSFASLTRWQQLRGDLTARGSNGGSKLQRRQSHSLSHTAAGSGKGPCAFDGALQSPHHMVAGASAAILTAGATTAQQHCPFDMPLGRHSWAVAMQAETIIGSFRACAASVQSHDLRQRRRGMARYFPSPAAATRWLRRILSVSCAVTRGQT